MVAPAGLPERTHVPGERLRFLKPSGGKCKAKMLGCQEADTGAARPLHPPPVSLPQQFILSLLPFISEV